MADRSLGSAFDAALADQVVRAALLYEAEFLGGWVRLWTGDTDLVYGGQTYTGIGGLVGLSNIEETGEIRASGISVMVAGLDPAILQIALAQVVQGKPGRVLFGLMDASGAFLADGPTEAFKGLLDLSNVTEVPGGAKIEIKYENRLVRLERAKEWRWTDQDQRTTYPTDSAFKSVGALADMVLVWGPR